MIFESGEDAWHHSHLKSTCRKNAALLLISKQNRSLLSPAFYSPFHIPDPHSSTVLFPSPLSFILSLNVFLTSALLHSFWGSLTSSQQGHPPGATWAHPCQAAGVSSPTEPYNAWRVTSVILRQDTFMLPLKAKLLIYRVLSNVSACPPRCHLWELAFSHHYSPYLPQAAHSWKEW